MQLYNVFINESLKLNHWILCIYFLWKQTFIRIAINIYIYLRRHPFTTSHIYMIDCFIQVFPPFSKKFWKLNSIENKRDKLFENILERIRMVIKRNWFEFMKYVGMKIYIGRSVTIRWYCSLAREIWVFVDCMDSSFYCNWNIL